MFELVIGPSSSGKSTYIRKRGLGPARYGHQLTSDEPPEGGLLHYNLLADARRAVRHGEEWDLSADKTLMGLLDSGRVESATVIVAPLRELRERMRNRTEIERDHALHKTYPSETWMSVLDTIDIFAAYEDLFDTLDCHAVPCTALYSSAAQPDYPETDRAFVHHNLRSRFVPLPDRADVDAIVALPGSEYQSVRLPFGVTTSRREHTHLDDDRGASFSRFRAGSLRDSSVLDIGCALGDMLFRYERRGATRLVGLDIKPGRLASARAAARVLRSRAVFRELDFAHFEPEAAFDDVLALNVIHHVADIRGFLQKAVRLARRRLVLEYPSLDDPRFQSLQAFEASALSGLPLMGVSSGGVDQTFVFTPAAVERMVREFGDLTATTMPSPIAHRWITVFRRAG